MKRGSSVRKDARVSVRFAIGPFEISIETNGRRSEAARTIALIVRSIREMQDEIALAVSGINGTKFKPINSGPTTKPEEQDEQMPFDYNVT